MQMGATIYLNSGLNVDSKKIRKMLVFTYIGVGDIPVEGFFTTNLTYYIFWLKDLRSKFKTNTDTLNRHWVTFLAKKNFKYFNYSDWTGWKLF